MKNIVLLLVVMALAGCAQHLRNHIMGKAGHWGRSAPQQSEKAIAAIKASVALNN